MQTRRKELKSSENIVATITKNGDGCCEIVTVRKKGKEITTFNVANDVPSLFLKMMVRSKLNCDQSTPIIIRRKVAMTA